MFWTILIHWLCNKKSDLRLVLGSLHKWHSLCCYYNSDALEMLCLYLLGARCPGFNSRLRQGLLCLIICFVVVVFLLFCPKHILCGTKCNFFCNVFLFSILKHIARFLTDYKGKKIQIYHLQLRLVFHWGRVFIFLSFQNSSMDIYCFVKELKHWSNVCFYMLILSVIL